MKAVIWDGSKNNNTMLQVTRDIIREELENAGWDVELLMLREKKISACLGCFDCWLKTPGVCIIDDDGRDTTRIAIKSDLLIYLTPIIFGGYSSELKKAVDRILPIFIPAFTVIEGEVHHLIRFEQYPKLIGIGVLDSYDARKGHIFSEHVKRNSINFYSPKVASEILFSNENANDIRNKIKQVFKKTEVI